MGSVPKGCPRGRWCAPLQAVTGYELWVPVSKMVDHGGIKDLLWTIGARKTT